MPTNLTDTVYRGSYYPIITEEGNTAVTGTPNSSLSIEILPDFSLKGMANGSRGIIEKFDLNKKEEVLFRSNYKTIGDNTGPPIPNELTRVINRFRNSINEMVGVNRHTGVSYLSLTRSPSPREETLNRLVYANIITILETFLSDYLITSVKIYDDVFKSLVKNYQGLNQKKMSLEELVVMELSPFSVVIETLENAIFHNVSVATSYYKAAFGIDISQSDAIISAVKLRHDIVHRSGKGIGEEHAVTIHPKTTHQLILDVQEFVISLLRKMSK